MQPKNPLKYNIKEWKTLMPKVKYTFEEVVKYMQKDAFKDNLGIIKTGIVIKRLSKVQGGLRAKYEDYNCRIFRMYLNYDIALDVEEYDKTCQVFNMRTDKTLRKLSLRNTFMLLENLDEKIEDMKFSDSWKAVFELIKEANEKEAKEDDMYCDKHQKAFLCGGDNLFYCPDCEKEIQKDIEQIK